MTLFIILGILAIVTGFMVYGAKASHQRHREHRGEATVTETDHYYGHLFYFNPDDKRIFVPKRTGGEFTVNFANPLSILAGLLVVGGLVTLAVLREA